MSWHTKEPWSASPSGRRGEPRAAVESGSNETLTLAPAPTKQRSACHARADMISTSRGAPSQKKTTAMKSTKPSALGRSTPRYTSPPPLIRYLAAAVDLIPRRRR
jgi:hypothetical protein